MPWNWQLPDWPRFRWNPGPLLPLELAFAEGTGVLVGTTAHLEPVWQAQLTVELMSAAALDTSAIEGEILDRESVQSSVRRHLGLQTEHAPERAAEAGIAQLMVELFQHPEVALAPATLADWHRLVMAGRTDIQAGVYRTHEEPMQIVSGPDYRRRVHFEAPPSSAVPGMMGAFFDWLTDTAPGGATPLPPVTRAGIAHLWFESIHPYEDGNGRLGRALSEQLLAASRPSPSLTGIATTFMRKRKEYYAALEAASRSNDIQDWLEWFAARALESQTHTTALVRFIIAKSRLLAQLRGRLNPRQEKALLRMFRAGPEGFEGGMSAEKYRALTGAAPATASRDLADLVLMGALKRTGERRGTRYHLTIQPAAST